MTNAKICLIKFENKDIINIIKALDSCKAHGYDDISIRMSKIYESAIVKPLTILLKNCISQGIFPDNWKKSNICRIYKKGDKQIVNNYRPVSLLQIYGKIFERLIFNSSYKFLEEHNLLSIHQSFFCSNDSCINQLLFIVHTLYKAFDAYPTLDARVVFLDMSQAFDKAWHERLLYKLKSMGVSDLLLKLFQSFLTNRFQRVLLNDQTSEWLPVKAGVPQGSILGPLLFLIYINDLSENIESTVKLFADDTSLFSVVHNNNTSAEVLNRDLQGTFEWAHKWKMSFNHDVSKQAQEVIFSRKQAQSVHPDLVVNKTSVH